MLLLSGMLIVIAAEDPQKCPDFNTWKATHNRLFETPEEEAFRQIVYADNCKKIDKHNSDSSRTFNAKHHHLAVYTHEEFKKMYLGLIIPEDIIV